MSQKDKILAGIRHLHAERLSWTATELAKLVGAGDRRRVSYCLRAMRKQGMLSYDEKTYRYQLICPFDRLAELRIPHGGPSKSEKEKMTEPLAAFPSRKNKINGAPDHEDLMQRLKEFSERVVALMEYVGLLEGALERERRDRIDLTRQLNSIGGKIPRPEQFKFEIVTPYQRLMNT